jgi:N-acetylneuraminic acid mutarotase
MKKLLTLLYIMAAFSFSAKADYWTQKADFGGVKRTAPFSFSIGNKGYVGCGGRIGVTQSNYYKDFWEYDPSTNAWTQKANFGGAKRAVACGFSIGNKGYAGLGVNFLTANYLDFWEYDPFTNVWTQKANFGGGARFGAVGFAIGSFGYIATGGLGFPSNGNNDIWQYNPITDIWIQKTSLPGIGRIAANGFVIGNSCFIADGVTNGNTVNVLSDLWEYNSVTDTWTQKANCPGVARCDAASFTICDKGYFGTGDPCYCTDIWQYNPVSNIWTQKTDFGGLGRDESAFFSIGNRGYIGLGSRTGAPFFNDFWEYTPDSACTTGIEEFQVSNFDFQISPNPAKESVVISSEFGGNEKIKITVSDVKGKKVFSDQYENNNPKSEIKIDTRQFLKGIYLVEIVSNQKTAGVKKLVIE